jgi:hypothetical protein
MSSTTITQTYSFSPANVVSSGCRLWLDAADATTFSYSSGSNLSQWRDKSGSNNHATATVGPVYSASSNSVYFVGNANSVMNLPDGTLPSGNSPYLIIAVTTPLSGGFHLIGAGLPGTNQILSPGWNLPTDLFDAWFSNDLNVTTSITFTNRQSMLEFNYNQSTRTIFVEGTSVGSGAASNRNSGTTSNVLAGYLSAGTPYTPMFLNEMIVYSNVVTTAQRQQVEGYLAWKWNLVTNLPSNHPFKTIPPFANNPRLPPSLYPSGPIRFAPSSSPFSFFNPASVTGCSLWLDAADPSSVITSGSNISQWSDKSGNGRHATQSTSANQPFYIQNSLNNLPVVSFTGSPYSLSGAPNGFVVNGLTTMTSFFVANNTTAQSNMFPPFGDQNCLISWTATGSWGVVLVDIWQNKIQWRFGTGQPSNDPTYTFPVNQGTAYNLVTVSKTNTNEFLNVNGSLALSYTAANTTIANTTSTYNLSLSPAGYGTNNVGEIIIYTAPLTTAQIQQVEGYLAWKWGFQASLPSNHPFKTAPPGLPVPVVPQTRQLANRSFQPTSFSGCQMWLDAADLTTLSLSGSNVTQWNDKSGQGYLLTVPGGYTSPVYSNGILSLTGSNSLWSTTNFAISGNAQVTMFLVGSITTIGGNGPGAHIGQGGPGSPPVYFGLVPYQDGGQTILFAPSCFGPDVSLTFTPNISGQRYLLCGFYNGTVIHGTYNGTLMTSQSLTTANFASRPFQVGNRNANSAAPNNGTVCETICYSGALSTSQRQTVEGYLAWKWGLVGSLPGSHPYKLFPPAPA